MPPANDAEARPGLAVAWSQARTLAWKDATQLARDGRFRWITLVLVAGLAASFLSGWSHTAAVRRLHSEAQATERQLSLDRGEMNPHAAAHYGAFVFKPVEPLSAIDPGVEGYAGVSVFLEAHEQQLSRNRPADAATVVARLGDWSAARSLQLLVPLFIVVLTAGAFAGERESGTLRQLTAAGIGTGTLLIGKSLGVIGPLALVLLPVCAIGLAGTAWAAPSGFDAAAWLGLGLMGLAYLLYFAIWTSIGLIVSTRARSTTSATLVLLSIWFAATLVAPRISVTIAGWRHPLPTSMDLTRAIAEARGALPAWPDRVAGIEEKFLLGELPSGRGIPSNPEVIALVEMEHDESLIYDEQFERILTIQEHQSRTYDALAAALPPLAIQSFSMSAAETDAGRHHEFLRATSDYRRRFVQTLNAELSAYQGLDSFDYTRGRELWSSIPEFTFTPAGSRETLHAQGRLLASLSIWLLFSAAALTLAVSSATKVT